MLIPNYYLKYFYFTKEKNIVVNNQKIHSKDEQREFKRISNIIPKNIRLLILIGGGNGEFLNYLVLNYPSLEKILVIEPIYNFIDYQKKKLNFSEKIKYIFYYKDLISYLEIYHKNEYYIFVYPVYFRLFSNLIDSIQSYFTNDLDLKTNKKFFPLWIRNYYKNLKNNKTILFISNLNIAQNKILFCGGGPTLWEDLKKYKNLNDFFIISSDTALIPLLKRGITVDIVISIDPNIGTLYHFYEYKEKIKKIPLITWLGSRWEFINIFSNVYYFTTNFPLDQILSFSYKEILNLYNPTRDLKGYSISLAKLKQKEIFYAGCGIENNNRLYYHRGTGYDYYGLLKETRVFRLEDYHYFLFLNQRYKQNKINLGLEEYAIEDLKQIDSQYNQTKDFLFFEIFSEEIIRLFFSKKNELLNHYKEFLLFFDLF